MDAKETSFYTAILIASIIIGVIIVYFIISIVRQQRKNLELYRQSVLAEITAMEKERARIAADLHVEVEQTRGQNARWVCRSRCRR